MKATSSLLLLVVAALPLAGQQGAAPLAVADTSICAPLFLPSSNEYRTGSGRPGVRY